MQLNGGPGADSADGGCSHMLPQPSALVAIAGHRGVIARNCPASAVCSVPRLPCDVNSSSGPAAADGAGVDPYGPKGQKGKASSGPWRRQ